MIVVVAELEGEQVRTDNKDEQTKTGRMEWNGMGGDWVQCEQGRRDGGDTKPTKGRRKSERKNKVRTLVLSNRVETLSSSSSQMQSRRRRRKDSRARPVDVLGRTSVLTNDQHVSVHSLNKWVYSSLTCAIVENDSGIWIDSGSAAVHGVDK